MGREVNIAVLAGDGIGPETVKEGVKVFNNGIGPKYGHTFHFDYFPFGAGAYFSEGHCFSDITREAVMSGRYDGIIKGPIGLDKAGSERLRREGVKLENETVIALRAPDCLDTPICYRPIVLPPEFAFFSPMRPEVIGTGLDVMMMRELTGGIYFGQKEEGVDKDGNILDYARDDCKYTREQVERFAEVCFAEARRRKTKLTNTHKANVKATGRLWKAVFDRKAKLNQNVPFGDQLIDSYFTLFKKDPTSFNGVVSFENLDGDYTTDDGGGVIGSLGLCPSACWNPWTKRGYFEPSHGSAPDIANQGKANPYSMLGSMAFMLSMALGMEEESHDLWKALKGVFGKGYMTGELVRRLSDAQREARVNDDFMRLAPAFREAQPGITDENIKRLIGSSNVGFDKSLEAKVVSTSEFGDLVVKNILG